VHFRCSAPNHFQARVEGVLHIHQINLQTAVGGGEVYTRWFTRALADAGAIVSLYVHSSNRFWDGLASSRIKVFPVDSWNGIFNLLPISGAVLLTQSRMEANFVDIAATHHLLTGFSHMPMIGRDAREFQRYSTVFTVSRYCIELLTKAGIPQVYPEAQYGVGQLEGRSGDTVKGKHAIVGTPPYHWDLRKGRDRLLAILEPSLQLFYRQRVFKKRPGLTLGIVSLISPIKQFPALFAIVAPYMARHPEVTLDIFGNGGYAQVRDLKKSLRPLARRVRFWGYQHAVNAIYPQLDYLMVGLPEKEALGLNALEAQVLGTPVIAPNAPPFTETIVHQEGGFLYRDPREDGGKDFGDLLDSLVAGRARPDPRAATEHLRRFSYPAMVERAGAVIEHLQTSRLARFG
jgi:glycosyltransferase involved in cell wall biosynthesis